MIVITGYEGKERCLALTDGTSTSIASVGARVWRTASSASSSRIDSPFDECLFKYRAVPTHDNEAAIVIVLDNPTFDLFEPTVWEVG